MNRMLKSEPSERATEGPPLLNATTERKRDPVDRRSIGQATWPQHCCAPRSTTLFSFRPGKFAVRCISSP